MFRLLATLPVFDSAPPGTNKEPMLNAASPAPRAGWSPVHWSKAMNCLPISASTPGAFDGSLATAHAVLARPSHISGLAIDTTPDTVLIRPFAIPTSKSV